MKIKISRSALAGLMLAALLGTAAAGADRKPTEPPSAADRVAALRQKSIDDAMKTLAEGKDAEARASAARMLGKVKVTGAVPVLTTALHDPVNDVRAEAAAALWRLAPDSAPAVPALEAALKDESARVRLNAAGALNALEASTPAKLAAVLGALLSNEAIGPDAARVLVGTDLADAEVRRVVLEGLTRGGVDVRTTIVGGIAEAELAPDDARPYLPALQRALKDENDNVRQAAARALNHAGGAAQRQSLEDAIAGAGSGPQGAARAVEAAKVAAAGASGGPVDGLSHDLRTGATEAARIAAAKSLGAMSASADRAAVALCDALLAEPSRKVRASIIQALHQLPSLEAAEGKAIAALVGALGKDPEPAVREEAASALAAVARHKPAAAVPALKAALQDPDEGVRGVAQQTLTALGGR